MIKKVMDNRRLIIYTMTPLNLITDVRNQKKNGGIHREKFREHMPGWDGHFAGRCPVFPKSRQISCLTF
jgi:hypothetical protein